MFQITKLKIDSNPFAKGFRDSSRVCEIERLGAYITNFAPIGCKLIISPWRVINQRVS